LNTEIAEVSTDVVREASCKEGLRKECYESCGGSVVVDLDKGMYCYNYRRRTKEERSEGNGFRKPVETHFRETSTVNMKGAREELARSIKGDKEVQEHVTFVRVPVETDSRNENVLECQSVTTP